MEKWKKKKGVLVNEFEMQRVLGIWGDKKKERGWKKIMVGWEIKNKEQRKPVNELKITREFFLYI